MPIPADPLRRREVLFDDGAGPLRQQGRQLARRVAVLPCVHPAEIRRAARGQKQRQTFERLVGHLPFGAVAANQRLAGRRVDAVAGDEVERGRELEQVPTEPRVIEIDHLNSVAVEEQIFRDQIGMYEPIAVRLRAVGCEPARHLCARAHEQLRLPRRERGELPKPSPERLLADEARGIPGVPPEPCRALPAGSMVVHARRNGADHLVLLGNGGAFAADATLDGSKLASIDPLEHVDLPRATDRRHRYDFKVSTVFRANRAWNRDAGRLQRAHPNELRVQLGIGVIAAAMHPQHGPPAIRQVDPEHRIFAHLDRRDVRDLEVPAAQGGERERLHLVEEGRRLNCRILGHSDANTWSSVSTSRSACCVENGIGGRIFKILSWSPMRLISTPRSRMRLTSRLVCAVAGVLARASLTSSTAKNIPAPRTSPMSMWRSASFASFANIYPPTVTAFSSRCSSSITSRTAVPTAAETGLPPNVLKYMFRAVNAVTRSQRATTAANG